jgi:hypothetical protein
MILIGDKQKLNRNYTTMSEHKRWTITLSDKRPLSEISNDLTKTGFAIEQVLTEIRCVTGTASDSVAKKLRSIPGVADVSPEHNIDIGPPDAEITW